MRAFFSWLPARHSQQRHRVVSNGAPNPHVSGITVPHHLVAANLIARAFRLVEGGKFAKVVILSPDHFKRATRPFATTRRDFDTVYGRLVTQRGDVDRLLKSPNLIE